VGGGGVEAEGGGDVEGFSPDKIPRKKSKAQE